ncbi:DUF6029 family protein [Flavobacterium dankookense]|uniref:Uncharacterized protein n=1 Tax=Flavobacterium dankookense TaxID=706186 RepID=A0A4R6QAR4_9FLAO|nr:DUF6029 family protein [Flavobacterium dankookense]TDP59325.1 hypothetical protein BC748_1572 [Flavobacterium dankookense]
MKYLFFALALLSIKVSFAQNNKNKWGTVFGGFESNAQWYLNDKERGLPHPEDPIRSNNYLFLNYNYKKWTTGFQIESYEPNALLNFNPKYKGTNFGTYFINYKSDKFEATVGHFYEQFGSGLILRTWEDRALGINNAIRGARIIYRPTNDIVLKSFYGQQRSGFDVSKGKIFGADLDYNLSNLLKFSKTDLSFGISYVGRKEEIELENPSFSELTNAFGARINFMHDAFYVNSEVNFKSTDGILNVQNKLNNDFVKSGSAIGLNFGYSKKGLGVDVSLRRLENFSFLSERIPTSLLDGNTSLNYNDKILNFTPALTKQHHSNLANIYVYQAQNRVDFSDQSIMKAGETGGQIDFLYKFQKGTSLGGKYGTSVAVNLASWYNLPGKYSFVPSDYDVDFFGVGNKYFSDYNIEIKKKLSQEWLTGFYFINQYYNRRFIEGGDEINSNIIAAEGIYSFGKSKSIRFEAEHLWADADRKNWIGGTLEYSFNDKLSVYVWDIYNYGNKNELNKTHYYNVGGAYRKGANRIAFNYGRQRGGLVCVGGVCRFVPESTGFTINLSTSF